MNYSEIVSEDTNKWVKKLMENFSLRICGIDVFVKDSINNPKSFCIIEINHDPNLVGIYELGHQDKTMQIWNEVLEKYFKQ